MPTGASHPSFGAGLLAGLLALAGLPAAANDGYFLTGIGAPAKGAGGAGIAFGEDALAIATNPALAPTLGHRADLGFDLFRPDREAVTRGNAFGLDGRYDGNQRDLFAMGDAAYVRPLTSRLTFGIAAYANGGMNTEYGRNPYAALGGTGTAGVDLKQLFVAPTLAYSLSEDHRVGVSLLGVVQSFEAYGIGAFASGSLDPGNFSDRGRSMSVGGGVKVGYHGRFGERLAVGASYQAKLEMGEFDEYRGLFAGKGSFDIPATWGVGAALGVTERLTFVGDVRRIEYGDVPSIANSFAPALRGVPFGAEGGPGFGWQSISVYKIGAIWRASERLTLRAGYSRTENPIPESETFLNILAPGVATDHYAIGATWQINDRFELGAYGMHAPENEQRGRGSIPSAFGGGESDIALGGTSVGLSVGIRF